MYTRSSGVWSLQAYLKAPNTRSGIAFGSSVGLFRDTAVVGAPGEASCSNSSGTAVAIDTDCANTGAVYVFARDPFGSWSFLVTPRRTRACYHPPPR